MEKRETRYRVQWYYRLFEETQRGLTNRATTLDAVHGSLLALGELLRHTGDCFSIAYSAVPCSACEAVIGLSRWVICQLRGKLRLFVPIRSCVGVQFTMHWPPTNLKWRWLGA